MIGGGCVLSTQTDQQKKKPSAKMCKKCKKKKEQSNIEKFSSLDSYKIHISGAANRYAPVPCAKYVFFSFLSKQTS